MPDTDRVPSDCIGRTAKTEELMHRAVESRGLCHAAQSSGLADRGEPVVSCQDRRRAVRALAESPRSRERRGANMARTSGAIPFGLLFEEPAQELPIGLPVPVYDEDSGISYLVDEQNQRVPYMDCDCPSMGTETRVQREMPDAPLVSWLGRTETSTAVAREPSDADVNDNLRADLTLAIHSQCDTMTKAQRERND